MGGVIHTSSELFRAMLEEAYELVCAMEDVQKAEDISEEDKGGQLTEPFDELLDLVGWVECALQTMDLEHRLIVVHQMKQGLAKWERVHGRAWHVAPIMTIELWKRLIERFEKGGK